MSETIFEKVDYDLGPLVKYLELDKIAFNPLSKKSEVADAAIRRDEAYIPDMSVLWSSETRVTNVRSL